MVEFSSPLRLHLDGATLVANWRYMQSQGNAACGAAVKANGYGLGARQVVARLRDAGCRNFFVAHWGEALEIADLVPPEWIAVLNGIEAREIPAIKQLGAIPVLNTPHQLALWKASGGGTCHVMVDTGINRLGIGPEHVSDALFAGLDIDLLISHLASADEDSPQNAAQLDRFQQLSKLVTANRYSLANSAGVFLGPDYHFDLVRPGLALYGGVTRPEMEAAIKPVVKLAARILQTRWLQAGDSVGYNATYICSSPTQVATISIGYADGYLRSFGGVGLLDLNGKSVPVIGRVSMDLVTVDITSISDAIEGDWIDVNYNLAKNAKLTGLSQYELLTNLGKRFEYIWS
ncbi:alanine racemase [Sphingorhabdus sp. IMCC26285]|uniref:Alanine racemase n=1 Tax=Sphingorhabdus profundilacus TaxID=2509718 RepID=A0A6I4M3A4_9SPHN|nr:alanine racemase [Sphingorhabdus profundilacus]MVZ96948.1 alanine racemase [Sphingorhabdus profundilacus]